ncbi:MAG: hypothetical protein AAGF85_13410 [Bacteroidota bacterium]
MAKRKNPLKDLDSFLKQEASSIIEPEKISPAEQPDTIIPDSLKEEDVLNYFKKLALEDEKTSSKAFLNALQKVIESQGVKKGTDKMLLNTLLYLQNQDNWKEAIAKYWSVK